MEQEDVGNASEPLSHQALASLRSLIINPTTTDSAISSILETLTRSLQFSRDSALLRHVLNLLSDLSSRRHDLSPRIFDSVRSSMIRFATESTRLAAESLTVLAAISDRNPSLALEISGIIDGEFFVSLCFAGEQPVSVRMWLLRNAERFRIRPCLLFTVFLGFTKDPYPLVRKAALDGLAGLCRTGEFDQDDIIEGCYSRAVELLGDAEDSVRSSAVSAVSEWGQLLIASKEEMCRRDCSDAVFIQLCSVVRDMSVEVRVETFNSLAKIGIVSENVLLQTLSKKILRGSKEKKSYEHCADESSEVTVAGAAGVFVHGIEDEFYEVRRSAVDSLKMLTALSTKFATEALDLLMDMLYDDSMVVRLKVLETIHHMANCGHLRMQEMHMHGFLGTLVDSCKDIRSEARKILKLVKLPDIKLFKQTIDGLLKSLEMYPQDEPDVFSALFHIGQSHGNSAVSIVKRVSQELEVDSGGKSNIDSIRLAALLVLGISAPLSDKQNISCIPPWVFSYSLTMLGRFSRALSTVMDQNTLLAYLSQCSLLTIASGLEFDKGDLFLHVYKNNNSNKKSNEISSSTTKSFQQSTYEVSENESTIQCRGSNVAASHVELELEDSYEIRKSMNLILGKIKALWPLVQSGCIHEALVALRACKGEVATFTTESPESLGVLEFTSQYIGVMKLLARVWEHFGPSMKFHFYGTVELELLLGKLEQKLMEIRCRFDGLSGEEELHILQLVLLSCLLRLSKVEICCRLATMKQFSSTISRIEFLHKQGHIEPSNFCVESNKSLLEISASLSMTNCELLDVKKLIGCFSPQQLRLSGNLRHIKAELDVPDNNPDNPLSFVSGLPVVIPCEISLNNVSTESRLWLRITMSEGSTQFVFLDLKLLKISEDFKKLKVSAPLYVTPKAVSFTLMVSVGMECMFEDVSFEEGCGGPKHPLAYLCREREVYISHVSKAEILYDSL